MTPSWGIIGSVFGLTLLCATLSASCSRDAEIRDDYEPTIAPPVVPPPPDGGIPVLTSVTLTGEDSGACHARTEGNCIGPNDFVCDGQAWLERIASECREQTECHAGNWISVHFGEGCVDRIGMVEPEDAFVACLNDAVEQYTCPCVDQEFTYYLGVAEDECRGGMSR